MTPSEILTEARRLIETVGWLTGQYSGPDGYCSVGALLRAAPDNEHAYDAMTYICRTLGLAPSPSGIPSGPLMVWNDKQRGKDDVLTAFDAAIEAAKLAERGEG